MVGEHTIRRREWILLRMCNVVETMTRVDVQLHRIDVTILEGCANIFPALPLSVTGPRDLVGEHGLDSVAVCQCFLAIKDLLLATARACPVVHQFVVDRLIKHLDTVGLRFGLRISMTTIIGSTRRRRLTLLYGNEIAASSKRTISISPFMIPRVSR